jgi:nucleoside 2-deoxyribosyltransferase
LPGNISGIADYILAENVEAHRKLHALNVKPTKGYEFERDVAVIFRALGAKVEQDTAVAGNQIDIMVAEQTPAGTTTRTAVECKAYSRPVGVDIVNSFAMISHLLRQRGLIDKAMIIAAAGFTKQARDAAREYNVELLEFADLQQRVRGQEKAVQKATQEVESEHQKAEKAADRPKRLFVVMPFSKEFQDVYLLGIREVAEKLGLAVERADEIEHNEGILGIILERLTGCDAVVADTTYQNPNVFYEVGYCHGLGKPTILIAREGQKIPFDLSGMNHIFYDTLVDLRSKLEKRFRSMFDGG